MYLIVVGNRKENIAFVYFINYRLLIRADARSHISTIFQPFFKSVLFRIPRIFFYFFTLKNTLTIFF